MISKLFGKEEEFVWKDSFFKEDFTVDKFLSKNTNKSDLVSLRQGLKKFGVELHRCMSEILKNETEAIVNLAEALSNLTSKIDDLSKPASQLEEEIRALYEAIRSAQESFDNHSKKMKSINDKREFLSTNKKLISTCISVEHILERSRNNGNTDMLLLERAVDEYSFQKMYAQEKGFNVLQNECVKIIEQKMNFVVDETFVIAVTKNDEKSMERCLRMYVNLKRQQDAENLYREKFVHESLAQIFSNRNFEKLHELNKLFDQALVFLEQNMSCIINITLKNSDLKGFNFIINSFWFEVDKLLKNNLPNITAPGNPEMFQRRFKDTWKFLEHLSNRCGNPEILLQEKTFQEHIKRFNLAVYFEIRFQQIAGKLERVLLKSNLGKDCKSKTSSTFLDCYTECFKEDVYMDHLSSHFVKLSMLLLTRYLNWLETMLVRCTKEDQGKLEDFIVLTLGELDTLKTKIGFKSNDTNLLEDSVFKIFNSELKNLALRVLDTNSKVIDKTLATFQEKLVQIKQQDSMEKLQDVASVPRLYRRTNRSVPTEPSAYIISAVDPITQFHNKYYNNLGNRLSAIEDQLVTKIADNYLGLVQEVLHSVGKTEKSLRRLKNRTLNISEDAVVQATSDLNSDEGKIREQIRLDVNYFVGKLSPFTLEQGKKSVNKLMEELKSTN